MCINCLHAHAHTLIEKVPHRHEPANLEPLVALSGSITCKISSSSAKAGIACCSCGISSRSTETHDVFTMLLRRPSVRPHFQLCVLNKCTVSSHVALNCFEKPCADSQVCARKETRSVSNMSNARALEVEASIGAGLDSEKMDEVSSCGD
jgi:hypothetical protein